MAAAAAPVCRIKCESSETDYKFYITLVLERIQMMEGRGSVSISNKTLTENHKRPPVLYFQTPFFLLQFRQRLSHKVFECLDPEH